MAACGGPLQERGVHLTAPRDVPSQRTKRARLPGSRLEGASPTCNCLDGGPLERRCQQNSVLLDGREARAVESAEQFCAATGVGIRHSGSMAYHAPGPDVFQLPVREVFRDAESYAATRRASPRTGQQQVAPHFHAHSIDEAA